MGHSLLCCDCSVRGPFQGARAARELHRAPGSSVLSSGETFQGAHAPTGPRLGRPAAPCGPRKGRQSPRASVRSCPLPCVRAPHQPNPPRRHVRLPSLTSRRLRQAPAPVPGGRQGAATLPRHGRAARVRRPVRAAVAPRTLHVPECEGPAHQHRSVSAVARGGRGPRRARPPAGLWGSSRVRLAERPQFACPKQDRGEARHGPEREGYPGSRRRVLVCGGVWAEARKRHTPEGPTPSTAGRAGGQATAGVGPASQPRRAPESQLPGPGHPSVPGAPCPQPEGKGNSSGTLQEACVHSPSL